MPATIEVQNLYLLAGGFPPGLNTATQPTDIGPDETPDGYGFDLSVDGGIKKGAIPTGTARVAKSTTLTESSVSVPYLWHYRRLWGITNHTNTATTTLTFGAMDYDDIYVPQRSGRVPFNEDSNVLVTVVPFGVDNMLVAKATGSYVVGNLSDTRALITRTDLIQELAVPGSTNVVELDGVVYVSNTLGLFAFDGNQTVELTRKVRDNLTGFTSLALVADYSKKRIICGTALVYEVETKKLFKYSTTAFRYTTRQFHLPSYDPISIDRVWFVAKRTGTDDAWLNYQTKYEDEDWSEEKLVTVLYEPERYTSFSEDFADSRRCKRFQMRITDMSTNLTLKEVRLDSGAFNADDYSA